jgi:hypothetical protein
MGWPRWPPMSRSWPLRTWTASLTDGELSPAHAQVLAAGTRDLPTQVTAEAEPVLVEAARRLDPPRLRRVLGHLVQVADHGGGGEHEPAAAAPGGELGLAARLGAAMALLPPILGGAPSQPLDVGRTTRVVQTAQRTALAVRDGVVCSPAVPARWLGVRPIICGTGWMAARPTWPTWYCCAGRITGPSMRAAGG